VPADRLVHIFELMAKYEADNSHGISLCTVAAEVTNLSGASILLDSANEQFTPLCAGNDVAQKLMDLEVMLGEGPGIDASRSGVALHEANLVSPESTRWMFYTPDAMVVGARAVFGYPIRIGAARFGSLSLYRDRSGSLSSSQSSDAYLMASVIGRAVLAMQAGAPGGALVNELGGNSGLDFTFHQAAGMLAVQASLSVKDALVALRSHAYATASSPVSLATRVVTRQTLFDPEMGAWREEVGA